MLNFSKLFIKTLLDGQIPMVIENGRLNLSSPCNTDCFCSNIAYTPVCLEETGDTFFSPCVASCQAYSKQKKVNYFKFTFLVQIILKSYSSALLSM